MKILIIGGNGYVGSNLKSILSKNHEITTLGRKNCDIIADITNFKKLKESIKDFDVVFHLAALISTRDCFEKPREFMLTNVVGTLNVLEACRLNEIKNIIFSSTAKVYGKMEGTSIKESQKKKPLSPYGYSKLLAEEICENYKNIYKMNIKILRIFNVYGPHQPNTLLIPVMINQIENEKIKLSGDNSTRDFIYIDDVCEALEKTINTNLTEPINIGTGKSSSPKDIAKNIEKITGKQLTLEMKEGMTSQEVADVTLAKEILNWEANISLEQGLKKILNP
jgi:nucleoside-diphosphate-sugar epimerase